MGGYYFVVLAGFLFSVTLRKSPEGMKSDARLRLKLARFVFKFRTKLIRPIIMFATAENGSRAVVIVRKRRFRENAPRTFYRNAYAARTPTEHRCKIDKPYYFLFAPSYISPETE